MSRENLGRRATGAGRLITTTLVIVAVQLLPGVSAQALVTSTGQRCTVVGTTGNDVLVGTASSDVICGRGGKDALSGRGGNDVIDGGSGADKFSGGAGADLLLGGGGGDTFTGGTGADKFSGGDGFDTVSYADHTASVRVSLDGRRNDGAVGERDLVTGTVENLTGGAGSDTLIGSSAVNALSGGAGNDTLTGAAGTDTLTGNAGNDILTGGSGADTLTGGDGTDAASYADHAGPVSVDLDGARDDGAVGERDLVTGTVENLTGGPEADILSGSKNANTLAGGGGADTVSGASGNDRLLGNSGADTIFGEAGDDDLTGGSGADTLDGGPGVNPCRTDPADTASLDTCEDVTPPRIVEWSVTPPRVDTRTGDRSVTVTARVEDDLTGPEWFNLSWESPRGAVTSTNCIHNPSQGYTDCSTGSALDQTMTVNIDLPQYSHLGQWTFPWIEVVDRVGNTRSYPLTASPVSEQPGFYNG